MQKHVLVLTTSTFILACGAIAASAQQMQQQPQTPQQQEQSGGTMGPGMGRGGMGPGGMMGPANMRMVFALMDSDGDGHITLQEFQAAHERIFKAMDAKKDGRLTQDEVRAFREGGRRSASAIAAGAPEAQRGGTMGPGMGRGGMGPGGMMGPANMPMVFALMDSDGDGNITLQEFQAAHERIFKAMDANKDGRLTLDEVRAFREGGRRSASRQ
jgi:Ca2+-binding EF-hand superfamily protein